jgi:hypothetical protein
MIPQIRIECLAYPNLRVTIQSQAAKDCHCERSEAISNLGGLLSRGTRDFTPRNDKHTPRVTEWIQCDPLRKNINQISHVIRVPGITVSGNWQTRTRPVPSLAASIIPWLTPNLIFRGFKLATTTTVRFKRSAGL